jgi:hypothetical protein
MTSATASAEGAGWAAPLKRPIRVKNGPTLRTLDDARGFIWSEPGTILRRKIWRCGYALLLFAAKRGGDIGAATEKVELALFLESRLLSNVPLLLTTPAQCRAPESGDNEAAQTEKPSTPAPVPESVSEVMELIRALSSLASTQTNGRNATAVRSSS